MSCSPCDLRDYLLGELAPPDRRQVEKHVGACDGCREELERLQALRTLLRTDGVRHSAPETLNRRIATAPELAAKVPEKIARQRGLKFLVWPVVSIMSSIGTK